MMRPVLTLALLAAGCASSSPAPIAYRIDDPARPPAPELAREPEERPTQRAEIEYRNAGPAPPSPVEPQTDDARARSPATAPPHEPDWADGDGARLSDYALPAEEAFDPWHLPATHRASGSESLYDIATLYQVPVRALIDLNRLEPPYDLARGRVLELPQPRFHTVAPDETFAEVAQRYNVEPRSLGLLNHMREPFRVLPGDRLALPALARAPASDIPSRASADAPAGSALAGARFQMPLDGAVTARFGAQPGGAWLDGVEIAGREGDAIVAADAGEVVYAGADLAAYGTLVLLRHEGGYVTAYGFARRALVREGQHVRAGQRIAELGPRPDGGARLFFQVRQGSDAVDPAPFLGVGARD